MRGRSYRLDDTKNDPVNGIRSLQRSRSLAPNRALPEWDTEGCKRVKEALVEGSGPAIRQLCGHAKAVQPSLTRYGHRSAQQRPTKWAPAKPQPRYLQGHAAGDQPGTVSCWTTNSRALHHGLRHECRKTSHGYLRTGACNALARPDGIQPRAERF